MVEFSKLLLIKKIAACVSPLPVILRHNKQFFLSDISSNTLCVHYFSTLVAERQLGESLSKTSDVVSYLIDSCGLSPESAKSASKMVKFETPERPDSVIELFRNFGFDQTHIPAIVRKRPRLLLANPEKTLLPKLEFFLSLGLPKDDLAKLVVFNPSLLARSLENQIIPYYKILKNVLGDNNKVIRVFKSSRWLLYPKAFEPNIAVLRQLQVTASNIELLLTSHPSVIMQEHERFLETIDQVKEMGFDPWKSTFVLAVQVLSMKSKELIWNRCFETYKKWGWSEDDILSAFKKHPHSMTLSQKKIERAMDFFVNKMGYQSKVISEKPAMLFFSFEKRIIPRCSVIQVLTSKGLIENVSLGSVLTPLEKIFLRRYVTRYEDQLPFLMSVYRGEINIFPV